MLKMEQIEAIKRMSQSESISTIARTLGRNTTASWILTNQSLMNCLKKKNSRTFHVNNDLQPKECILTLLRLVALKN